MEEGYGPASAGQAGRDSPRHGTGWRFLVFAVVVAVGVPALVINGVELVDEARSELQDRRYAESVEPARQSVARMVAPGGTTPCDVPKAELDASGQFCWQQELDTASAKADLLAALRAIGATKVESQCVKDPAGGDACVVYAQLVGQVPFCGNVRRPPAGAAGRARLLTVSGGMDTGIGPLFLFERTLPGESPPPDAAWWGWEVAPGTTSSSADSVDPSEVAPTPTR